MLKIKSLIVFIALLTIAKTSSVHAQGGQIIGPTYVAVSPNTYSYYIAGVAAIPYWSVSNGATIVGSSSNPSVSIRILQGAGCTVTLTANAGIQGTFTLTLEVDPYVQGPTVAYPGESAVYTAWDPCGSHICANHSWTAPSACVGCGMNSNTISVTLPLVNPPATFNVRCNLICASGFSGSTSNYPVTVKLRTPTITYSGPSYCHEPITFTASLVNAATSYVWTLPTGWSTISSTLNTITVLPNGTPGTVSAVAKCGPSISSAAGSVAVTFTKDDSRHNLIAMPNSDVFYIGYDLKIHRMYWNSIWNYDHLVPSGGWGSVDVEGWMTKSADNNSIYFKSRDSKLYELTYPASPGAPWTCQQITAAAVDVKGNIACREDGVFYIGTDDQIHRVYKTGATWNYQALIPSNWQGITIQGNLALAPYPTTNIYFRTTNNKLYNLYGDYNSIIQAEIPTTSGCSGDIITDPVTGRIYFKSTDKIHYAEWVTGTGWQDTPIIASNTNYSINGYIVLAYYKLFFKGMDGKLHNIYESGSSWVDYSLSASTNVAGDIVALDGKIMYINVADNRVHQYTWLSPSGPWVDQAFTNGAVKTCSNQYTLLTKSVAAVEEEPAEGIEEAVDQGPVTIYPNPAKGEFTIKLSSEAVSEISVFDMLGNKIKTYSNSGKELLNVDLSSFPKGIYLVNILQDNKLISKKVVLE